MKKSLLFLFTLLICFSATQAQSIQKVVVEEHSGAWCGYCLDGARILDDILVAQNNAIGVTIHQGDAMAIPASASIRSFYSPAFPQATINREGAPISRGSWAGAVNTALTASPTVVVSIDSAGYDANTRLLKVKVKATFVTDATGQFRINVYLTENNVTGTGSGYDQVNYYNGTQGSPFYGLGNPVVGYVHNHVLRDAIEGAWGKATIIPGNVLAGEEYTYTFATILNAAWDLNEMHIVGLVNLHGGQLPSQRPTLNAEEVPMSFATGIFSGPQANGNTMEIFPNPVTERATVSFNLVEIGQVQIDIYNLAGQKVKTLLNDYVNTGMHSVYWNGDTQSGGPAANGMYLARMTTESGASVTKRLLLAH